MSTEEHESPSLGEVGAAYAGVRSRVTDLVRDLDETNANKTVPACPEWRVHDLVSHVAGVVDDVVGGRLEGAGSDPWTAAQVHARKDRPTAEVVIEWSGLAPQVEVILDSFGPVGRQAVMDVVTHEHDLRSALGAAGARDSDAVRIGTGWLMDAVIGSATMAGHPALRLRTTEGEEWTSGEGEPVATVTGSTFDLLRACSGRRTIDEIRALDWEGDVDAVLPAFTFGPFTPLSEPLGE